MTRTPPPLDDSFVDQRVADSEAANIVYGIDVGPTDDPGAGDGET